MTAVRYVTARWPTGRSTGCWTVGLALCSEDATVTTKPEPTHIEFQAQIVDLCHSLGYHHLHVRRTIGRGQKWVTATNVTGWPDIFAWGPRGFVALELKVGRDKATVQQTSVLAQLEQAGARCMVAYPSDIEAVAKLLNP